MSEKKMKRKNSTEHQILTHASCPHKERKLPKAERKEEGRKEVEEFRLSVDLYGDEGNFGLLSISDNRTKAYDILPSESFPMEDASPEEIGRFVTEYLKKNCMRN